MVNITSLCAHIVPATAPGSGAHDPAIEGSANASQMAIATAAAYGVLVNELVAAGVLRLDDVSVALAAAVDEMHTSALPGSAVVLDLYRKALG
jgi:hypothetical protein